MISVVVPIYNAEKYLRQSIESVLKQSYKEFELVLVNDGSTDKSLDICWMFQKNDKRIKVINQSNQGLSAARNIGIENSDGEYLFFLDADDLIDKFALETMYSLVQKSGDCIVVSNYSKFKGEEICFDKRQNYSVIEYTHKSYMKEIYLLKKNTYACFTLIPRTVMADVRFPCGKYFEDMATMYKVFLNAKKIIYVDKVLAWYRQHEESIIATMNEKKAKDYIEASEAMCECVNARFPELEDKSKVIQCYCKIAVIERSCNFTDQEFVHKQYQYVKHNIQNAQSEVKSVIQKIKFQLFRISPKLFFCISKMKK